MGALQRFWEQRNEAQVVGLGASAAVLGFALLQVWALPGLDALLGDGALDLAMRVLLAAVTLSALLAVCTRAALNLWSRPWRGRWVYRSSTGTFGDMTVDVRGFSLGYHVSLYRTADEVLQVLDQDPAAPRCFADVTSRAFSVDGSRADLIYVIDMTDQDYEPREGVLTLKRQNDPRRLNGYWFTSYQGPSQDDRKGTLEIWRPELFRARHVEVQA